MIANAIEIVTKFASAISSDPLRISLNNGSTKNNNKYDKKIRKKLTQIIYGSSWYQTDSIQNTKVFCRKLGI